MSATPPKMEVVGKGRVEVGARTSIAPGVQVVFHRPATVRIGDYCSIGAGVKFVVDGGDVTIGDWTSLHDRTLVLSTEGLTIGQHGWFGQHCVIDGSGGLTIGDGVRVGMYSQLWTHVAAGERIEGCTLYGMRPTVVEDDVWLVGSCIVSSGVRIGRRTVALIASNITKSWPAESVLAGSPAVLKSGLSFYSPLPESERWSLLRAWLEEIAASRGLPFRADEDTVAVGAPNAGGLVLFLRRGAQVDALVTDPGTTVCCLETKRYRKTHSDNEHFVLKALSSNRARFRSPLEKPA